MGPSPHPGRALGRRAEELVGALVFLSSGASDFVSGRTSWSTGMTAVV